MILALSVLFFGSVTCQTGEGEGTWDDGMFSYMSAIFSDAMALMFERLMICATV